MLAALGAQAFAADSQCFGTVGKGRIEDSVKLPISGAYLKANLNFMKGKPRIRHDEHYHVDFAVPCKSNAG